MLCYRFKSVTPIKNMIKFYSYTTDGDGINHMSIIIKEPSRLDKGPDLSALLYDMEDDK